MSKYPEIEYIEKPFILEPQDEQSYINSGINKFKQDSGLTGKGVILGIIDSGIDYYISVFKNNKGDTKILYFWDQSIQDKSTMGVNQGALYTKEDIDKAINGDLYIPVPSISEHGTNVAGICSEIAMEASMIVVKVGKIEGSTCAKSTDIIRAIKFILDKGIELSMPVVINISYGSNEGNHKGTCLFESYINCMCSYWKNNIVVAVGNSGDKSYHKNLNIKNKSKKIEVEFKVEREAKQLSIELWPDFADDFMVYLESPQNQTTQLISLSSGEIKNIIGETKIKGFFYTVSTYFLNRKINIEMTSDDFIDPGIWKIVVIPVNVITGNIDIYILDSNKNKSKFLIPDRKSTVTSPGTAENVITVGSYNHRSEKVSTFSGEGNVTSKIFKPEILAPGEDIAPVYIHGAKGPLRGTSMSAAHITGVCALILEWGIVKDNDSYLYSQKLKSLLIKLAKRDPRVEYPNNSMGYGKLNVSDFNIEQLKKINTNQCYFSKRIKKVRKNMLSNKNNNCINNKLK